MPKTVLKKLYVFDGGQLELDSTVMVSGQNPGKLIRIPVQYFLLETSRGYVLVDTGNDPEVIKGQDVAEERWGVPLATAARPVMEPRHHPFEQLKLVGLSADDIKMVVYTHLHHDHCGGARLFPDALHVVQKSEYRWAHYLDRFASVPYNDSDYRYDHLNWRLAEGDWCILPGVHLISTPGHTPGHQSVALWDVPDVGSVILAGDAVNCRENIVLDTPGGITSDATAAMASVHRLSALAEAMDATMLVSHDQDYFDSLPKAPEPLRALPEETKAFYKAGARTVYGDLHDPDHLI
jgi:N-acyl homoserine lactone hydrolase